MAQQFTLLRRVQFAETDMAGILHFSNYFRYMEEVEHAFFRSLGLSVVMKHEAMELGWPRVSCSCEFSAPIRFEEEIELQFRIVRLGDKSITYEVDFLKDGQRRALGKLTSVCCTMSDQGMRPTAIPAPIRAKLQAAM